MQVHGSEQALGSQQVQAQGVSIDIDEVELLNDVEMGGMSHDELVAHIRRVQQEVMAKVRRNGPADGNGPAQASWIAGVLFSRHDFESMPACRYPQ